MMNRQKTVWITGASSGLGLHTAFAFRDAGYRVIAGARSFTRGCRDGIEQLPLDVTDEDSVNSFVSAAHEISPRADVLIQCAGILILGPCEELTTDEYRRVMDTNFLGMVRVNRAVLPLMREQGGGRVILFSSINGLLGIPFESAYTASKHAIEGYTECLQTEVKPFNIEVMLVEPGDHRSGSDRYRMHAGASGSDSPYAADYASMAGVMHHDETNGSDPDVLGRKLVKYAGRRRLPYRKCIASADQHLAVWLHKFAPARLNASIIRDYYIKK